MVRIVALGVALVGMPAVARAGVIIDSFTGLGSPNPWPVTLTTVNSNTVTQSGLSGVLGGSRTTQVTATSVTTAGLDRVEANMVSGLFDYLSTVGADGSLRLTYDGGGVAGGLNADLRSDSGINIDFVAFNYVNNVPLPVTVTISDGANSASQTKTLSPTLMLTNPPRTLDFWFSAFAGISAVNLASLDSISVAFDPATGQAFRLQGIAGEAVIRTFTSEPPDNMPEPGSLAVWALLGGVGLWSARRRFTKK